jgi:hypothetical protein
MTTPDLEPKGYRSELESPEGLLPASLRHGKKKRNLAESVTTLRHCFDAVPSRAENTPKRTEVIPAEFLVK